MLPPRPVMVYTSSFTTLSLLSLSSDLTVFLSILVYVVSTLELLELITSVSKRSLMLRKPAGGEGGVMPSLGCLFRSRDIFLVRLVGTILVGRNTT